MVNPRSDLWGVKSGWWQSAYCHVGNRSKNSQLLHKVTHVYNWWNSRPVTVLMCCSSCRTWWMKNKPSPLSKAVWQPYWYVQQVSSLPTPVHAGVCTLCCAAPHKRRHHILIFSNPLVIIWVEPPFKKVQNKVLQLCSRGWPCQAHRRIQSISLSQSCPSCFSAWGDEFLPSLHVNRAGGAPLISTLFFYITFYLSTLSDHGLALTWLSFSCQGLSHWFVEDISLDYRCRRVNVLMGHRSYSRAC